MAAARERAREAEWKRDLQARQREWDRTCSRDGDRFRHLDPLLTRPPPARFQAPVVRDGVPFHPLRSSEAPSPAPAPALGPPENQYVDPNVIYAEPLTRHENHDILQREITQLKQIIKDLEKKNRILQAENKDIRHAMDEKIYTMIHLTKSLLIEEMVS